MLIYQQGKAPFFITLAIKKISFSTFPPISISAQVVVAYSFLYVGYNIHIAWRESAYRTQRVAASSGPIFRIWATRIGLKIDLCLFIVDHHVLVAHLVYGCISRVLLPRTEFINIFVAIWYVRISYHLSEITMSQTPIAILDRARHLKQEYYNFNFCCDL